MVETEAIVSVEVEAVEIEVVEEPGAGAFESPFARIVLHTTIENARAMAPALFRRVKMTFEARDG